MTRALLLSGYHADSHARWADGVSAALANYEWTTLTLPPRHFRWRLRGNAWWWALQAEQTRERYDLVLATSMVDLASLIGLCPQLGDAHKVLYFHENQFSYPRQHDDPFDINLGIANIYSALAADVIAFNSRHNLETMLTGVDELVTRLPDFAPRQTADLIRQRSHVIAVGLEDHWFTPRDAQPRDVLQIVWNHRWEYDKAPDRLFDALQLLDDVPFELHVVGRQFRTIPQAFRHGRQALADKIGTWGYVESATSYRQLLRSCDLVVSTALHEFQGLAVLEAVASGCIPVVPDRLSYQELFDEHFRYASHPDAPEREAKALADHIRSLAQRLAELRHHGAPNVEHLRWSNIDLNPIRPEEPDGR